MTNRKVTFIFTIIFLIITLPLAGIGTYYHLEKEKHINKKQEFKFDGKLYFYNNKELLGTYTCENFNEYCDYAPIKAKKEYKLDEYPNETGRKSTLMENQYALLFDTKTSLLTEADILLYDVKNGKTMGQYKEIKDYGIGIDNDLYIIKNTDGLWGVLSLADGVDLKIPFGYTYIGLKESVSELTGKIEANLFAVLKDGTWKLVDVNNTELTSGFTEEIFSYNEEYVVTTNNDKMTLLNYKGEIALEGSYKYLNFHNKYIVIMDEANKFYLYDIQQRSKVSEEHLITSIDDVVLSTEGSAITITINDVIAETVTVR